jgi:hypothetical protein
MQCPFCSTRLNGDQLRLQLVGEPRDDLVLHVEEVGHGLIESFSPEMLASLAVN